MSELKARFIDDTYVEYDNTGKHDLAQIYLKSEADKVIAEKDKAISELKEAQRWRKFPDEKPTEDIKFLVINEKGMLQCCYYSPILEEFQIPVTHWMPLPSAPKEEK